ncbi:hypothetical protein CMK12_14095 [Candidatus Poribacteria bacterium]|nr:hypothetical protein [Candidatus Poribacteria bacterium]
MAAKTSAFTKRKGGPRPRGNRQVFDGIIWVLPTGPGWNHLADRYPSASTCRPRL